VAKADAHLYKPATAVSWRSSPSHGGTNRRFEGRNPQAGVLLDHALAKNAAKVSQRVLDVTGNPVTELRATGDVGRHIELAADDDETGDAAGKLGDMDEKGEGEKAPVDERAEPFPTEHPPITQRLPPATPVQMIAPAMVVISGSNKTACR
jgi:hypothetical protein